MCLFVCPSCHVARRPRGTGLETLTCQPSRQPHAQIGLYQLLCLYILSHKHRVPPAVPRNVYIHACRESSCTWGPTPRASNDAHSINANMMTASIRIPPANHSYGFLANICLPFVHHALSTKHQALFGRDFISFR